LLEQVRRQASEQLVPAQSNRGPPSRAGEHTPRPVPVALGSRATPLRR
jgi:hypothetical protein